MLPLVSGGFPTHPLDDDIQVTKEAIALMGTGLEETNIFAWPTKTTDFGIKDWRAVHSLAKMLSLSQIWPWPILLNERTIYLQLPYNVLLFDGNAYSRLFLSTFSSLACYQGIQKLEFSQYFSEFFSINLSFLKVYLVKSSLKSKIRGDGIQKSEFLGDFSLSYVPWLSFFRT